ncbi:MAG TPA: TIR domain-containing protein [Sphingomicrobium sp.]|nr:TIR domain-containing protein [Sphingomicrobium sp.]
MSDVFISYARSSAAEAGAMVQILQSWGYDVWWDAELPPNRDYADVIEERLSTAKAVLVLWSAEAVKSQWVRSEADRARSAQKLVQLTLDGAALPMPFDRVQLADLACWNGTDEFPGWRKVMTSIAELAGPAQRATPPGSVEEASAQKLRICVLPFANMSDDAQQEYFSDGISEDIITDLSKVSALSVVARNTAFTFKGKHVDVPAIARQLQVGHVLEGSVRKSGNQVRITAQLIDASTGGHVWAERYDRQLDDVFALQDEISLAIVDALKLTLLPQEKQAIARRGTENAEAYDLYLMARRYYVSGRDGERRGLEPIIRLCERATEIDPNYARAWALMAVAQTALHFIHGKTGESGFIAVERAVLLDPNLAEAHAVRARHMWQNGDAESARAEIEVALRLDPESFEANAEGGRLAWIEHRFQDAASFFEKAAELGEESVADPGMLLCAFDALGDEEGVRRAARMTLDRAERALAKDPNNGSALGFGVNALGALGEAERAREWIDKALLVEPDNMTMRYNFACFASARLHDPDQAVDLLRPVFETATSWFLNYANNDADLDPVRHSAGYQSILRAAQARLSAAP